MARITMPVEAANAAIQSGALPEVYRETQERWKPEAMYFGTFEGKRTAFVVFDMPESSKMPVFAEPFFEQLHAEVTLTPVMNAEDLATGLSQVAR